MYTATKLGDTVDRQTRRRVITVHFTNGESEFDKDFSFAVETELITIKKTVKDYLDELNYTPDTLADGAIDFSDIPVDAAPEAPTAPELAKTAWDADLAKLKVAQELVDLGVLTGNEAPFVALKDKVKAGFKPAYMA